VNPYDEWGKVVEVYSRTRLTKPDDKLIALSGIAKMMSAEIKDVYVAGMWRKNLASQLLWRVDPVWENDRFHYRSTRPEGYRAPSFSWAAIDAEKGIKYGQIIEEEDEKQKNNLYIEVEEATVTLVDWENPFGLVEKGHLKLSGLLQKIEMNQVKVNKLVRYEWRLTGTIPGGILNTSPFSNVYLDSPSSDRDTLGPNGHLYCVPALKDSGEYLICLLLQLERKNGEETGFYKRVGLTKVPPYNQTGQDEVMKPSRDEVPYGPWNARTKKHTVCIV
jgi:hypothetical protein